MAVYGPQASVTGCRGPRGECDLQSLPGDPCDSGKRNQCRKDTVSAAESACLCGELSRDRYSGLPVHGVVAAVIGLHMPTYLDKSLTILGDATEGTASFVTGLIASAQRFNLKWGVGWSVFGKNVIQPALCLAVALLIGMPVEDADT